MTISVPLRRGMSPSIRIAALEEHAAAGGALERIVASEEDLRLVGVVGSTAELWPLLRRTDPDVVVLDLDHPDGHGLSVCLEVEDRPQSPPVAVFTAVLDDALAFTAALAGAGAIVAKSSANTALSDAVRALARSPRTLQSVSWRTAREVRPWLDPADRAILAMRLAGDAPAEIGGALGLPTAVVRGRIAAIIARVVPVATAAA